MIFSQEIFAFFPNRTGLFGKFSMILFFRGIPTTVVLSGILLNTTLFAPIFTLFPIFIGPKILAPSSYHYIVS